MRKAKELRGRLLGGVLAFVVAVGMFAIGFYGTLLTSYAAGQAKVTAPNGAKIRESADTASTMVGGAEKDKVLTVLGQTQGADGYTWYQVQVNDTTTGYVRADLVEVSGDIPAGGTGEGGETGGNESAPPADVTQVNPASATVSVESAEIRDTASMAGQVLETVPGNTAITVTGYVTDAEGTTWYQVNYISGETQVNGFLLADSCNLLEELTLLGQAPVEDPTPSTPDPEPDPAKYTVVEKDGKWLLVDNETDPGKGLPIDQLLENADKMPKLYADSEANVKKQKIIIIVLVFLLVAAVAGIAFLVFKIRDMMDSAYFNEVESETLRRKNASGGAGKQKPAMHTVGPREQQSRTAGTRTAGTTQRAPGSGVQRTVSPTGQRSMSTDQRSGGTQGQRVAGTSTGTRPAGGAQGTRPAGNAQGQRVAGAGQGSRSAGSMDSQRSARPAQRPGGQSQRPAGASQGARRPGGAQQRTPQGARPAQGGTQKAQPKNFMTDDDEFEFEFLNYDGDEE